MFRSPQGLGAKTSRWRSFGTSNRHLADGRNPPRFNRRAILDWHYPRPGHDGEHGKYPRAGPASASLPRPAALCKDDTLRIGRATKQACKLERLVTFRARGQQAGLLQRVCRANFPVDPVGRVLCFFVHDGLLRLPIPGKPKQNCRPQIDSNEDSVIPGIRCFYDVNMFLPEPRANKPEASRQGRLSREIYRDWSLNANRSKQARERQPPATANVVRNLEPTTTSNLKSAQFVNVPHCEAMRSAPRCDSAKMVNVGFEAPSVGKMPGPATQRFGIS